MNMMKRRIITIILAALIVFCFTGCTIANPTVLNEKMVAMLDLSVQRDTESRFALLYPGVTDEDTYRSTAQQIDEYFPVTEGYTWELQQWHITKSITISSVVYEGQYKVGFDGKVFYLLVIWRSDSGGEGFTKFQVISEEEWVAANNK